MVFTTGIFLNSGPQQKPPKTASWCRQVGVFMYPCQITVDPSLWDISSYLALSLFYLLGIHFWHFKHSPLPCRLNLVSWLQFEASYWIWNFTCSDSMNCPPFVSKTIIFMADHSDDFFIEPPNDGVLPVVEFWLKCIIRCSNFIS